MMNRSGYILILILLACSRDANYQPDPLIITNKTEFLTTEWVEVSILPQSNNPARDAELLARWDWDGDGQYDSPFSSGLKARHTYDQPGTYTIIAGILDLDENSYQTSLVLNVQQGYSKPIPALNIYPETGNIKTIFHFDATATADAEEENDLLTFSWDFDGNHEFEQRGVGLAKVEHKYEEPGNYRMNIEVTDTTGLSAEITRLVEVTMIDTLIIPVIHYIPEYPTDRDSIFFTAAESYYVGAENVPLIYSFRKHNGSWTEPGKEAVFVWVQPRTGWNYLTVRVFEPDLFYMEKTVGFQVTMGNRPPTAFFHRSSRFGNSTSVFRFDAWGSSDLENMPSELLVQWDFDGDGSWDTQYSDDKFAEWRYNRPGVYQAKLRVMDTGGAYAETDRDIHVSPYQNPTGYIYDERSALYYGTVKVGNQWWMGENLRFNPNNDTIPGKLLTWCYDDNPTVCAATGKLYHAASVLNSWNGELQHDNLCPPGWRLPSADDWRILFSHYGIDQAGRELIYGGQSDFNALYGGYGGYHRYGEFTDFEMDSVYKTAVFLSTTGIGSKIRVFQLKRDSAKAEEREMVVDGYYSVRCIRKRD